MLRHLILLCLLAAGMLFTAAGAMAQGKPEQDPQSQVQKDQVQKDQAQKDQARKDQAQEVQSDREPQGQAASTSGSSDPLRQIQLEAAQSGDSAVAHWGTDTNRYSSWGNHSNRLIPVYTFGLTLDSLRSEGSSYRDPERLKALYGEVPAGSVNPTALYYDQTDIYRLQQAAVQAGYSNIILMVFDGMDWQTAQAAAMYRRATPAADAGRGRGLSFLDERRMPTDFAFVVTSAWQTDAASESNGGYDSRRGGEYPWWEQSKSNYLLGLDKELPHGVTDSAASATSLCSGIKTYNGAINVDPEGNQVTPIARQLQEEQNFRVGVVTSVPVSHATPAAAYANNVARHDYQDISRDLLGLPSSAHRRDRHRLGNRGETGRATGPEFSAREQVLASRGHQQSRSRRAGTVRGRRTDTGTSRWQSVIGGRAACCG